MDGSQRELSHAFDRYGDELFRHCALRLRDRERAVEITQECFLLVWDYMQKGQKIEQMRPFLYRTLRHLIIDEYRKKKAVSLEAIVEGNDGNVEDLLPPDESNTLEAAVERHDGARVLEALTRLPEPYRESVTMRYVDGLSPQEIAKITGESENAVSVRVHRGLKKLKTMLEENTHE